MSRIIKLAFLIGMVAVLAACGGESDSGESAPIVQAADATTIVTDDIEPTAAATIESPTATSTTTTTDETLPRNEAGEQLVARVNGEDITLAEFQRALERQRPPGSTTISNDVLGQLVLDTMIQQRLINQNATNMGITITTAEIDTEYQRSRSGMPDDAEWQNWLEQNNFTEDELRQSLREWLLTQRMQEQVVQVASIEVDQVRARHIVVDTVEQADTVLARLSNGEDFGALAAEYSKDVTTRDDGGNLGWFGVDDLLAPELAQQAFNMQIGEVAGPIETMLGYHVVQVLDKGNRQVTAEDGYADAAAQFEIWLAGQIENADVERYVNF